jgi:hypothetical protein
MKEIITKIYQHYGQPIARMDIMITILTFVLGMTVMPLLYHLNIKLPDSEVLGASFNNMQIGRDIKNSFHLFFFNFVVIQFISAIPRQIIMNKFKTKWFLVFISSSITGCLFYLAKQFLFALAIVNDLGGSNEFIKTMLTINAGWTFGQYVFCLLSFYWMACYIVVKRFHR